MNEQYESYSGHRHRGPSNRWWSELALVVKSAMNSLLDWCSRDRIRIAPTAGRLLGLKPQDHILLRGRLFDVQEVRASFKNGDVICILSGDGEPAILKIERGENGHTMGGCLELAGQSEFVFDDDVVVLDG